MQKSPMLHVEEAHLTSGTRMEMEVYHAKQDFTITASCQFAAYPGLRVGRGVGNAFGSAYVDVYADRIEVWNFKREPYLAAAWEHKLDLNAVVNLTIRMERNNRAYLLLSTASGLHRSEPFPFWGCGTICYMELLDGQATNAHLRYLDQDKSRETWLFGDSYFDFFPAHMAAAGYGNFALDGRPGRGAVEAIASLKHALERWPAPKRIVWVMGMNNPDREDAINPDWKASADELQNICKIHDVELIFCTIPNVPPRSHSFKNAYIRQSGCRICDLAAGVEPNGTSEWYPGLLGKDNVHPLPLGAQMIAMKLINDVPEVQDI